MNKKAFTLAEVLITLTIIGVIAAITIPNLIKSWEEHHTVSAVKEAYSIFNNAFKMMVREEGYLTDWNWPSDGNDTNSYIYPKFLVEKLQSYIKTNKIQSGSQFRQETGVNVVSCYNYPWKNLTKGQGGPLNCNYERAVLSLANGMTAYLHVHRYAIADRHSSTYNTTSPRGDCDLGVITIDINGYKRGPNRWGYDIFAFEFYFDGLQLRRDTSWGSTSSSIVCTQSGSWKNWENNGLSCGYWIMMHGNTDYQKREVGGDGWAKQ